MVIAHEWTANPDATELLGMLHRSGRAAHLWADSPSQSYWFSCDGGLGGAPSSSSRNWYFSVNPCYRVPPHSTSGNTDRRYIKSQLAYIQLTNCLYAEYDGKDAITAAEIAPHLPGGLDAMPATEQRKIRHSVTDRLFYLSPDTYKQRALAHIDGLTLRPSRIVDSGGGYHCYWLLDAPLRITDDNRSTVASHQRDWVRMVDGDPAASDLSRILRIPGTRNVKTGWDGANPIVRCIDTNDRFYALSELLEALQTYRATLPAPEVKPARASSSERSGDSVIDAFNDSQDINQLLSGYGYTLVSDTGGTARWSKPGSPGSHGVLVNDNRSFHFADSDPMYDACCGGSENHTVGPFEVYMHFEHNGELRAAVRGAAELLGLELPSVKRRRRMNSMISKIRAMEARN